MIPAVASDGDAASVAAADAARAARLLAIDPSGIGGVLLRARPGEARDAWLASLRALMPPAAPWQRLPLHVDDERLLGGLDLGATLQAGRPVAQAGLLARCDGGTLVVAMAERLRPGVAARLAAVLDTGVVVGPGGSAGDARTALCVVALDEGVDGDEAVPAALRERLGVHLAFDAWPAPRGVHVEDNGRGDHEASLMQAARRRLPAVRCDDAVMQALCATAVALGVPSLRAPLQALRVARAAAADAGHDAVEGDDAALAARLVLAPRATRLPAPPAPESQQAEPPPPPPPSSGEADTRDDAATEPQPDQPLPEHVLQAARAAIPPGLLALLLTQAGGASASAGGRAGAWQASRLRGRPYGARRGDPRGGARLNLVATLRAAAPWQRVRARESGGLAAPGIPGPCVRVRREDFHVSRWRQRRETTTVFVVDASGSAALHRLGEAKGAIELLLADCYVRRDRVALLAFRGSGPGGAELLLPPTRSLVRAKRGLAALPGGGGTPLAAGLDAAGALVDELLRRGGTPVVVLLTDGRANVARDGRAGRQHAFDDALAAARPWRGRGVAALLLDTSPQPQAQARELAQAMGARYLPLPHADAQRLSQAVRQAVS